jgi:hypothetical protein
MLSQKRFHCGLRKQTANNLQKVRLLKISFPPLVKIKSGETLPTEVLPLLKNGTPLKFDEAQALELLKNKGKNLYLPGYTHQIVHT